jgi:hypothetical protein
MLRFGLVRFSEMKTANLTKPRGSPKSHPNPFKLNAVFAVFGLNWFGLRFLLLV